MAIKWDKETGNALADPNTPDWVEINLINGLRMRAAAKEMEINFEKTKDDANELLAAGMGFASLKKVKMEGVGQVIQKAGSNVSYPKDKISDALLARGVDAVIIGDAIQEAKTTRTYTSFEFRAFK